VDGVVSVSVGGLQGEEGSAVCLVCSGRYVLLPALAKENHQGFLGLFTGERAGGLGGQTTCHGKSYLPILSPRGMVVKVSGGC
jgi:hypothetical protein